MFPVEFYGLKSGARQPAPFKCTVFELSTTYVRTFLKMTCALVIYRRIYTYREIEEDTLFILKNNT